ncbi:hypothetical protein [Bradyrhizobium sp. LeoA1S1]
MTDTRLKRVRRIRDDLECGLHRAVEIERGAFLLDYLDRAKALGSTDGLADVLREVVLDQYRIRDIDMEKIGG